MGQGTPEERARRKIDTLPTQAGWQVQDFKAINITAARGVALCDTSPSWRMPLPFAYESTRAELGVSSADPTKPVLG